jgi:hypothetical protein
MSEPVDNLTVRCFHNFAVSVIYVRCALFLSARFSRIWRLTLVVFSMKLAACHRSGVCSSEIASRYLEKLWTLYLSDGSSLNGFSFIRNTVI